MSNVKGNPARRPYESPVRAEGARRTRQSVLAAAGELFVERGYSATSLADIASAAGVARPTVFAVFGSKPALLRRLLDEALAGDDAETPVAQRPWFQPVWDANTPVAVLDAYADVCMAIFSRTARLFETVRRAADDAPDAAQLWQTLQTNRHAGARMIITHLRTLGPLAPELNADSAADVLWIFNDPSLYAALVMQRGWPEGAFRDWLANSMRSALLPT